MPVCIRIVAAMARDTRIRDRGNKTRRGVVKFKDGMTQDDNGSVSYTENGKTYKLDPMRQTGVDLMSMTAENLGFDLVFYRSTKDGKGRFSSKYVTDNKFVEEGQQAPSGFWRGGKMYIDVNAGMNGEGLILFTASHELVHMIREGSPEDFKALADFLVKNYSEKGVDINDLIRAEMAKSTNLTYDEAYEEVIAESCESFLRDTLINGKAKALYQENPNLWTKIKNALKKIIDRLKGMNPQSEASKKALQLGVDKLEQAYDLWTKGIVNAAENLRNMESGTDTRQMNMARIGVNKDNIEVYETSEDIMKMSKTDRVAKYLDLMRNEYRGRTARFHRNGHVYYAKFDQSSLRKPIFGDNRSSTKGKKAILRVGADGDIFDLVESSIYNGSLPNRKNNTKADYFDYYIKTVQIDNSVYDLIADIEKGYGKDGGYIYTVALVDNNMIKASSALGTSQSEPVKNAEDTLSANNIPQSDQKINNNSQKFAKSVKQMNMSRNDADYLNAVERGDMETAQKMVDEAAERAFSDSQVRDDDGKLLKVYHGTKADFNVFDIIGHGGETGSTEGLGIYLTERKDVASVYGGRVIESYANAKKLASSSDKTITKNEVVKLIKKASEVEAEQLVADGEYDSVSEALLDTWISNYVNTYEYNNINDAYKAVADTVLRYNENDRDIIWEVINGSGASNSNELWVNFQNNVITPTLNIDGFVTKWDTKDGKTADVIVVFDSSQVKSADPVTYDDNGNVVPLSERFQPDLKDIRYMSRDRQYDFSLSKDLDTLDEKALKVYNKRGWAYSLFSNDDMALVREKFDEYYQLKTRNKENILYDGTMVTDVNNKMLLIGGTRNSPIIHAVLYMNADRDGAVERIREAVYYDTEEIGINARQFTDHLAYVEDWEGKEFVRLYRAEDYFHINGRPQERAISPDGFEDFGYVRDYEIGRRLREEAGQTGNVKFMSRNADNAFQDFEISDWYDDDTTADIVAREYVTHHEDIGEVLKNIADIDITPAKVTAIVNRVIRENIGSLDKTTRELLSTEVQIALGRVNSDDPATVINSMTQAVRDAIENANVTDENAEANYNDLLSVFKGKRYYLSDEQLNYLKEHDSSLGKIRRELQNRVNIIDKANISKYKNAQELSLESLYEVLESPDEYLSPYYAREEWDEHGYEAPFIIRDALNNLKDMRSQPMNQIYSDERIDELAVALTAKIAGGVARIIPLILRCRNPAGSDPCCDRAPSRCSIRSGTAAACYL